MGQPDWHTFLTAYEELTKRGVSHDAAADKALYLAQRGALPQECNWWLIAKHCHLNEVQSVHNQRCVSLSDAVRGNEVGQEVALGEVLGAAAEGTNPERITIAREALSQVPADIFDLFADRQRPLTDTECGRIHRFRKRSRGLG